MEKLSRDIVKIFLDFLSEHRGDFLRRMGEALSDELYGVLTGTNMMQVFSCEDLEDEMISDGLAESDELISFCKVRSKL